MALYTEKINRSHYFDVKPRYDAIREIIDACDEKVIVFVPFTSVIGVLLSQLKTDGYGVSVIDRSVSDAARSKIFSDFRTKSRRDAQIIVAHPASDVPRDKPGSCEHR